jgi:hypothetical protein
MQFSYRGVPGSDTVGPGLSFLIETIELRLFSGTRFGRKLKARIVWNIENLKCFIPKTVWQTYVYWYMGPRLTKFVTVGCCVPPSISVESKRGGETIWIRGDNWGHRMSRLSKTRRYRGMIFSDLQYMANGNPVAPRHEFQTEDSRLESIADKVFAHDRLSFDDAVGLYGSPDILGLGWPIMCASACTAM